MEAVLDSKDLKKPMGPGERAGGQPLSFAGGPLPLTPGRVTLIFTQARVPASVYPSSNREGFVRMLNVMTMEHELVRHNALRVSGFSLSTVMLCEDWGLGAAKEETRDYERIERPIRRK